MLLLLYSHSGNVNEKRCTDLASRRIYYIVDARAPPHYSMCEEDGDSACEAILVFVEFYV